MAKRIAHLRLIETPDDDHYNVWRHGTILVLKEGAMLPSRCVRCGEDAEQLVAKGVFWHSPFILPIIFLSWPFYLLLAVVLRRIVSIHFFLCDTHWRQRIWMTRVGLALLPCPLVLIAFAVMYALPILVLLAIVSGCAAILLLGWVRNPIWAVQWFGDAVGVQNVHSRVLSVENLPVWGEQNDQLFDGGE